MRNALFAGRSRETTRARFAQRESVAPQYVADVWKGPTYAPAVVTGSTATATARGQVSAALRTQLAGVR